MKRTFTKFCIMFSIMTVTAFIGCSNGGKNNPVGPDPISPVVYDTIEVTADPINDLYPSLYHGDRYFGFHPVDATINASLTVSQDQRSLILTADIRVVEKGGDSSAAYGAIEKAIYTAPEGWVIVEPTSMFSNSHYVDSDIWVDQLAISGGVAKTCTAVGYSLLGIGSGTGHSRLVSMTFNTITYRLRKL
jgi:hypothetical protein